MMAHETLLPVCIDTDMTFLKMTSSSLARMYKTELSARRMALHMYASTLALVGTAFC